MFFWSALSTSTDDLNNHQDTTEDFNHLFHLLTVLQLSGIRLDLLLDLILTLILFQQMIKH